MPGSEENSVPKPGRPISASSSLQPLQPGDPAEVAEYALRARLGAGGMGVVYLTYSRGGQPVALKLIRSDIAQDPEFRTRFRQEVAAARRVHGTYTVPVVNSDVDGDQPWLATAYVPAPSLMRMLHVHGPLPYQTGILMLAGIAEALQSIHLAGVIHRDLKPSNVLLAQDGPKVIDFGIARAVDGTAITQSYVQIGTPGYIAPEQVRGDAVTPAADMFALGVLAHGALVGRNPFGGGPAHAMLYRVVNEEPDLADCPASLADLVRACLAKDPSLRPSPAEFVEHCVRVSDQTGLQRTEHWLSPALAAELTSISAAQRAYGPQSVPVTPDAVDANHGTPSQQSEFPTGGQPISTLPTSHGESDQAWPARRRPNRTAMSVSVIGAFAVVVGIVTAVSSNDSSGGGNAASPPASTTTVTQQFAEDSTSSSATDTSGTTDTSDTTDSSSATSDPASSSSSQPSQQFLSDMNPISSSRAVSAADGTLSGTSYPHSLIVKTSYCIMNDPDPYDSEEFDLGKHWSQLTMTVGIDDDSPNGDSTIQIIGDGRSLASEDLKLGTSVPLSLDVRGVLRLSLRRRNDCSKQAGDVVFGTPTLLQ